VARRANSDLDDLSLHILSDLPEDLCYQETLRALNEARAIAEVEPSRISPEELWSNVQDDIQCFRDVADEQKKRGSRVV
jgi:hypothetical protein